MDKDLYRIMKQIQQKEEEYAYEKGKFLVKDVEYIGTIELNEKVNDIDTKIVKDIFKVIEEMEDGSIIENYYDEELNFVAGRDKDGRMLLSEKAQTGEKDEKELEQQQDMLQQIEELREEPGISLNQIENELELVAEKLGISIEEIIAMTEIDLDQEIGEENKEAEQDEKITLNEDGKEENDEEQIENNEKVLENMPSKQEIDLDKKVDDVHTLGQILGVKPGAKLIAVYSDAIENNSNTTRFSFIIKNADKTIENADMLDQVGGKTSNKDIYEINRDGSEVNKKAVQSSYEIDSPLVKDGILTARIGQAGYVEVGYGQMDKTHKKDALTHEVKTDHTKDTTYKVREEFSYKKGTENIKEDLEELKEHEKAEKEDATLENADGDPTTGHKHLENLEHSEYEPEDVVEQIRQYEGKGRDNIESFGDKEIEERLVSMSKKYPDKNLEELIEVTQEDIAAEHIITNPTIE